jgi:hypothetical protein
METTGNPSVQSVAVPPSLRPHFDLYPGNRILEGGAKAESHALALSEKPFLLARRIAQGREVVQA